MTEQTPIISFDHVVKEFKQAGKAAKTTRAVDDVTLTINEGDIFGIIGYSGAGKSTLVRLINALEKPTSGRVTVLGTEVSALGEAKLRPIRQKIGMIFQQFNLFSTKTVAQNIAYPLKLDHWRKDYQNRRVKQLLEFVGLSEHANKYPSQLSGGQKQRVGIARALATNPKILLADEATSALDPETTTEVLSLLKRVNEELGITIVVITHQMNVVQQIANRVAVMSSGKVVEQGNVYDVFAAPRQQVTKRFIATALNGVPERSRVERMHEQWPGRLVTVLIRQHDVTGDDGVVTASGQNISQLIAKHGIDSSLLYGGIDTVKGSAIGAVTYEFRGDGVEAFLAELQQNSDIVDFGTAANPVPYEQAVARDGQDA
ncbi:ABC superfamily ATP binding cassette transporter, ABC protein [Bifidobacterium sp. DSM 109960]|uniref:ABC superfamily ATP binding cassette transporter, ABC protein n=1 Tax=Bifidobacterium erythrocebi TaxID=2675325 RepID=A0A7Y0EU21_9BIFI|nr:methionine ABC transporter ATP-binding protein [Bifidobacterium sp. DSM 109960]NMM95968.1 ABC superfamily ATP binding cassette transporter, ABC protein [Bifidobacterium sp. DSM 109960]